MQSEPKRKLPTDTELQHRRGAAAERLSGLFANPRSVAAQSAACYGELLDEALLDVAIEVRREAATLTSGMTLAIHTSSSYPPPQACPAPLDPLPNTRGPVDVFGQSHPSTAAEPVVCMNCSKKVAAGRFAHHLEKCMGRGRVSARTTSRQRGA